MWCLLCQASRRIPGLQHQNSPPLSGDWHHPLDLAEPVGVPTHHRDLAVVEEAVEDWGGSGVGQEVGPLLEGPVRGHDQAAAFIGGGDEPEEVVDSDPAEG